MWSVLVLLLLVALVPVLLVELASSYRELREDTATGLRMDLDAARAIGDSFESYIAEQRRDAASVARAFVGSPPAPRALWNRILARSIEGDATAQTITWADATGRVQASSDPGQVGQDLRSRPWFRELGPARDWVVSDITRPPAGESATFALAQHVRDDAGLLRGVMVTEILPEALTERLALRPMGSRLFSIADRSGWLVYHYPPERVEGEDRNLLARYPELAQAQRTQRVRSGVDYDQYHRERHLFAILPLPSLGWTVAVAQPEREVISPVVAGVEEDVAILCLVALVAFVVAAAVARRVSAPVERLSDLALAVGGGEFSLHAEPRGPREVRRLAVAFNRMAGELQAREREHGRVLELERDRAREARVLEAIQEHTDTLLAYFDRSLRFRQVNAAYCRFLGHPREEVIGRHYTEVSDSAEMLALLTRVRDTGETLELHEYLRPASGHPAHGPTYWDAAIVPVRTEEGEVEGVVLSATEVTQQVASREQLLAAERERAEAQRVRAKVAETVAAETNHRMKNNLSLISGVLQLQLQQEPPESPVARALRDAMTRIGALAVVHEQLSTEHPGKVELRALLQRVARAAVGSLAGPDLTLSCACAEMYVSPKAGSTVAVAANEMITNAIKYGAPADDGKRHVAVALESREGQVVLGVWNSGNPVSADLVPAAQRGLGLRLLREIAASQLKGTVSLRPAEGGTRCEVTMDPAALDLSLPDLQRYQWQI